tara:strand:+ start:1112 stop:2494 length:1383 start_codon:yes stop_codon:yes gene_type:complete
MAPGWALPAATLLAGLFSARGNGGGSEFSDEQRRLYGTQADIADMMADLYQSRIANEERYLGGAMDRVFGYVDDSLGRNPDLLYAPGIFEFMPRDARGPEVPRPAWEPYVPGEQEVTQDPPPDPPPFPVDEEGWRSLEGLKPVRDVVPPMDLGVLQNLMMNTMGSVWDKAGSVVDGMKDKILGSVKTDWESWSDEEIWENLWEGEDKPGTSWKDWLGLENMNTADALRGLENIMRDTLGLDHMPTAEQQEAFSPGPHSGRYDPEQWMTLQGREVPSSTFVPPGGYTDYPVMRVDTATGEVLGPQVPEGGTPIDLPPEITADPSLWANYGGTELFTGLMPGVQPERADDRRERIEREDAAIESGEYRELTPEQYGNLQQIAEGPGDFLFQIVERDGKVYLADALGMSDEQIEKILAGTYDAAGAVEEVWNRRVNPYFPTPPTPTPKPDGRVERPGPRFFDL